MCDLYAFLCVSLLLSLSLCSCVSLFLSHTLMHPALLPPFYSIYCCSSSLHVSFPFFCVNPKEMIQFQFEGYPGVDAHACYPAFSLDCLVHSGLKSYLHFGAMECTFSSHLLPTNVMHLSYSAFVFCNVGNSGTLVYITASQHFRQKVHPSFSSKQLNYESFPY